MNREQVVCSDCLEYMKTMPENSVDSIVTDPPYGLSFMGAKWDSFNGGSGNQTISERQAEGKRYADENKGAPRYANSHGKKVTQSEMVAFQAAMTPIFEEALRVAKPGAHLLCFGGTRTFHRMACAIEDAGWEIRDCIMWVYGCLDEETEILVDGKFVPYNKAKIGSLALGYDIERGTFSWQRIEDTYLYDYDDTAYAIQSDCTDQLVSRNHRCIVERGGVEQFAFAEQVASQREACVPVLEGLQGLLDRLPLPDEGAGDEEQDVLEGVRGEGGESRAKEAQGARTEHDMPSMREGVLHTDGMEAQGEGELLLGELQKQGQVRPDVGSVQQGAPDANDGGEEAAAKRADDWTSEPVMEGRGDVSAQPRELQGREVRPMPQGVLGDGTQGRVCDGAQARGGSGHREAAGKAGMRASRQSRPVGQQTREPDAVPIERSAQDLRELWGAKATLARVTPVHYVGKMWCIKVATGAFVARRHGKIFITGNSGFPKSMDVGKAIDKALGAEREKVPNPLAKQQTAQHNTYALNDKNAVEYIYPQPVTDQAHQWDGWGTCLKPAWEPIIVARKPLDGTVAHNVLTWGVGALNIDACRVEYEDGGTAATNPLIRELRGCKNNHNPDTNGTSWSVNPNGKTAHANMKGRFPANLVHDGSQMVLDLFPDSKGQQARVAGNEPSRTGDNGIYGHYGQRNEFVPRGDTGSAARFFYCAKASKKDRNYGCERLLTWAERDQELTQLLEQASNLLARDISESMMLNLVEQGCSTSLFGNENMVLSQEECRFITSTVIPLITASKTCSSSPRSNTSESILDAIRTSEESGISLARLADKSSQSRQDSTSSGTDTATSAVSALFGVLSEIRGRARVGNFHCTVKPIALMKWLVKLVTPEGGVVLDPFAGSGSTLVACKMLGRDCIGIEREPEYVEIIRKRLGEA